LNALATRIAPGMRVWIAAGATDMRRGFDGLSSLVQNALEENPFSGNVFVFRGRRGDLIKILALPEFVWVKASKEPVDGLTHSDSLRPPDGGGYGVF
jgi:hypothetical protein